MISALLFLALAARASEPPKFSPDADLKSLAAFAAGDIGAVNKLLALPLEKAQIPALQGGIDELQGQADGAAAAGAALDSDTKPPLGEMTAQVKGAGGRASFDERLASVSTVAARRRWKADEEKLRAVKDAPAPPGQDPEKRKDQIKAVEDQLSQADTALSETDDKAKAMDEARAAASQDFKRAAASAAELSAGASGLSGGAADIRAAAPEAKAAIALLGTEPENETRTRANQKLQPVLDGGRLVYSKADVARNRTSDFGERYAAFLKDAARFEDSRKTAEQRLSDAGGLLDSAEAALAKLSR